MQENIRKKSQKRIVVNIARVVYFVDIDYFTASTAGSSPFFSVVVSPGALPLSYESALVWPQASVKKTSIEGRQRLKVKNQSFQPFDLFIRNWFHTLLLLQKSYKNPLASAHIIFIYHSHSVLDLSNQLFGLTRNFETETQKRKLFYQGVQQGVAGLVHIRKTIRPWLLTMTQFAQASRKRFASQTTN